MIIKISCFGIKLGAFLFILFSVFDSSAQTTGNDNIDEIRELEKGRRKYAKEIEEFEVFTNNFAKQKNSSKTLAVPDTSCVVTIPVVFHVFHPTNAVTISQINYAISDLNITFGGADADYGTVNAAFAGVKSYTKIRFALAKFDPNGVATTGVVFYNDKQIGYANSPQWDNEIAAIAWDNYKYFNIYVMNDLFGNNVPNNSGFCFYPSSSQSNARLARLVYNYWYLGQGGASFNNLEFNQTFTHECGHYLNLYHTFDGNNCAGPGDNCNDTPPTDIAGAGCSATVCTNLINGENYMDYNATCYKNFTMDQNTRMEAALVHPARYTLWQYDNLVATGIINPATSNSCVTSSPFFSFSKTQLVEHISNFGLIDLPPIIIHAMGGAQFINPSQTLVQGTDYTIANLPAGLSPSVVTSADGKTATLSIIGQAVNHGSLNSVSNINFAFTNAAVVGGSVAAIANYSNTIKIKFYDPWGLTCVNPASLIANTTTTWSSFQTSGPVPKNYALACSAGTLLLQNYGRGIITAAPNSDNVVFLAPGTQIGPSSPWRTGGNQGLLYSNNYTALDGQSGYVGFRMQIGADFFYGYMTVVVSSVTGATITEYVYNNKPNDPIVAGTNCFNVGLTKHEWISKPNIYPNPATNVINVINPANETADSYVILDVLGRKVLEQRENTPQINIENLNKGFYQLLIISKGNTYSGKFIKE